jgi:hypothetical protein
MNFHVSNSDKKMRGMWSLSQNPRVDPKPPWIAIIPAEWIRLHVADQDSKRLRRVWRQVGCTTMVWLDKGGVSNVGSPMVDSGLEGAKKSGL